MILCYITCKELDADDPWSRYCPPPDPRLIFVTTVCSTISPAIQVMHNNQNILNEL